jgi:energy-coupling factor transporter ATP-binding protein EcfA2
VGTESCDVFISYARADVEHASAINTVLLEKRITTFFDREKLNPGLPWVHALEEAIGATNAVIVLVGPLGLGNTQHYEYEFALVRQTKERSQNRPFPVIPVLLPDVKDPPAGFLQLLTWVDFRRVSRVLDAPDEVERLLGAVRGGAVKVGGAQEFLCPYRGLNAFREEDAPFFFGRGRAEDPTSDVGKLVRMVREHPFVMVVGRSGSGKSSLVYAGLVPALRHESKRFWNVLSLRPGPEPLRSLAAAFNPKGEKEGPIAYEDHIDKEAASLRTGGPDLLAHVVDKALNTAEGKPDRLLLYIDQWEELYAQAPLPVDQVRFDNHAADVNRFVDLLLNAARSDRVRVVGSVRADFYDPLIAHPGIKALFPQRQVLLVAMKRDELRQTIVEPAKKVGLAFDPPDLVEQILNDAGEDEGMLPLLQFALRETWSKREGRALTGDSYARSGGVREAIRLTAQQRFDALSEEEQKAARMLFLRLVTPGEGQEDTRARALMPVEPDQRRIVVQFADAHTRLLVTGSDRVGRPTVEVAHEALIRTWPLLRSWIDANREKLRARAAIRQAQTTWDEQGRRDDLLLARGFQLERARALIADPGDIPIGDLREFVQRSWERIEDERKAREKEREAYVAALLARANAEKDVAREAEARATDARIAAAKAAELQRRAEADRDKAKAASEEANRERAKAVLARKYAEEAQAHAIDNLHKAERNLSYASFAGTILILGAIAAGSSYEAVRSRAQLELVERTSTVANRLTSGGDFRAGITLALNLLTSARRDDGSPGAWKALLDGIISANLESSSALPGSTLKFVSDAHHTPTADRVVIVANDGNARVCELGEGMHITCEELNEAPSGAVQSATMTIDGTRVITAHDDGTARVWVVNGTTRPELSASLGGASVAHVGPSQDGAGVLTASKDGTALYWSLPENGQPKIVSTLTGGGNEFRYITRLGSGTLTLDTEGHLRLWQQKGSEVRSIDFKYAPTTIIDSPIETAEIDPGSRASRYLQFFSLHRNHTLCFWFGYLPFSSSVVVGEKLNIDWDFDNTLTKKGRCIDNVLDARYIPDPTGSVVFITSDGIVHFLTDAKLDLNLAQGQGRPRFLSVAQEGNTILIFAETNDIWRVRVPLTDPEIIKTGCTLLSRPLNDLPAICQSKE